jgi:hypothetical protein
MYIMIMIQCHAYYMPKDIYHLIYLTEMQITPLSSALIDTSKLVSVQVVSPQVVHCFQTQFNTDESSGLYISS